MARTTRKVPTMRYTKWLSEPSRNHPKMTIGQRFQAGHFGSEICATFRDGHLDRYSTAATGGRSTHRVKQLVGKVRRQFHKREARDQIREV